MRVVAANRSLQTRTGFLVAQFCRYEAKEAGGGSQDVLLEKSPQRGFWRLGDGDQVPSLDKPSLILIDCTFPIRQPQCQVPSVRARGRLSCFQRDVAAQ